MVQVLVLSDKWLSRYGLLENFDTEITNWKNTQNNIGLLQREHIGRHGDLMVERRTLVREIGGSILTQVAVLCP